MQTIMIGAALVWLAFVAGLMIWVALEVVERNLFFPEVKPWPDSASLGRSRNRAAAKLPTEKREISTEKRPLAQ